MNRNAIRWALVLGILSMAGILVVQVFFIRKAWSQEDRRLNQTITIALVSVAEQLAEYSGAELTVTNPVIRYGENYYIVNVNIDIDPLLLEHYLLEEFRIRGLSLDFEYGIYNCRTDEVVYGRLIQYGESSRTRPLEQAFPKHEGSLYYFAIHFAGWNQSVVNSMGIWYFFSIILILVVIFFAYTQWIILRQKRFAEVQRDFINTMTHEFKTPLASLSMAADVLLEPGIIQEPSRLKKYGSIVRSQVNHLTGQVERVLEMGGRGGEKLGLAIERIDLQVFMDDIIRQAEPAIRCASGTIRLEYGASQRFIRADRLHLTNVIVTLVDNGVKYAGPEPQISVGVAETQDGLEIRVRDQGPGIAKEYLKRVFDKFYRVPTGNIHEIKGFGLGLYYARNVVRSHGWKIAIESSPGHGTTVIIKIPQKQLE